MFIPLEFIKELRKSSCRNFKDLRRLMSIWFDDNPEYFSKKKNIPKKTKTKGKEDRTDTNKTPEQLEARKKVREGYNSVPEKLRKMREDSNQCFRCGAEGHYSRHCPSEEPVLGRMMVNDWENPEHGERNPKAEDLISKQGMLQLGAMYLEGDVKKNGLRIVSEEEVVCNEYWPWTMEGKINDKLVVAFFDSGASHNFMTSKWAEHLQLDIIAREVDITIVDNQRAVSSGFVSVDTTWGDLRLLLSFFVVDALPGKHSILLGEDFLTRLGDNITMDKEKWLISMDENNTMCIPMLNKARFVVAAEDVTVQKGAQPIRVKCWGDSGIVSSCREDDITLIDVDELVKDGISCLWIRSNNNVPVRILKNEPVARFFPCSFEEIDVSEVMEDDDTFDEMLSGVINKTDWSNLEPVVEEMCKESELSQNMLMRLKKLLLDKFSQLKEVLKFDEEYPDIGAVHNIDTGDNKPFKSRMYSVPDHLREELKSQIEDFLRRGLIQHSNSPYSSPIVLIRKSNGNWRFCVDFRKLNSATVGDAYPIPRIENIMSMLQGAQFFSSLDFKTGFYHLRIAEEDRPKTAFTSPFGFYEWVAMPMGLKNAPSSFQRVMEAIFSAFLYSFVLIYIDDIIIFSESFDDHLLHIERVLDVIISKKLVLNFSKCRFATTSIQYLGHVVSRGFIGPNPAKVKAITGYEIPDSKAKLKNFLGILNYFRKFIPEFATRTRLLYDATRHDVKFVWTEEMTKEFNDMKTVMANEPILALPDLAGRFFVETDWSKYGVGGILYQYLDDIKKPIEYFSKKMKKAELNYSAYAGECYAILLAIRKWKSYLIGKEFTLRTDHKTLQWMLYMSLEGSKYNRWIMELSMFDFVVEHIDGKLNIFSDAFSRSFASNDKEDGFEAITFEEFVDLHNLSDYKKKKIENLVLGKLDVVKKVQDRLENPMRLFKLKHIRKEQELDEFAIKTMNSLESELSNGTKTSGFIKSDGVLYHLWTPKASRGKVYVRPYLPPSYRTKTFKLFHENAWMGGHLAGDRTYDKIRKLVWWPGMQKDISMWSKACYACQLYNSTKLNKGPMTAIDAIEKMDLIACDIAGPFEETKKGNRYIVVFSDYVTKFAWAFPVPNITAETIAELLVHRIVLVFGAPKKFLTDQGAQFSSDVVNAIFKALSVKHVRTTAYRPQADGQVERFNRTLKSMLKKYVSEDRDDWDAYIDYVVSAYNTGSHAATQESPYFLMFGSEYNTPLTAVFKKSFETLPDVIKIEKRNKKNMAKRLRKGLMAAKDSKIKYQETMKNWYDARNAETNFKVGDMVLRVIETPVSLGPKFKGPYEIYQLKGSVAYLKNEEGARVRKGINIDKLRIVAPGTKLREQELRDANKQQVNKSELDTDEAENTDSSLVESDNNEDMEFLSEFSKDSDQDSAEDDFVFGEDFFSKDIPNFVKGKNWNEVDEYKARNLVGKRFKAFFGPGRGWKEGVVSEWVPKKRFHRLRYDDGLATVDNMLRTVIPIKWSVA
eukprot:TRINITY_DN681_c0_g5_i1.p1 TRINITY_DN681_c0_g5~~TRINITY_DN681_c0_g5_i1.p1  ORF type:complete len:1501 (+),score=216.30 TRINITY_DN681_c0_g5_i1:1184-5686(+)